MFNRKNNPKDPFFVQKKYVSYLHVGEPYADTCEEYFHGQIKRKGNQSTDVFLHPNAKTSTIKNAIISSPVNRDTSPWQQMKSPIGL